MKIIILNKKFLFYFKLSLIVSGKNESSSYVTFIATPSGIFLSIYSRNVLAELPVK